jgi:hypothetical protein
MTQFWLQQSVLPEHTSPIWWQNEDCVEQTLFWHRPEQHCEFMVQALPPVLQTVLSGWQVVGVPLQLPLQQAPFEVHASPSETHAAAHLLATQLRPQQSVPTVQAAPVAAQVFCCVQVLLAASHTPEQQVALVVQAWPNTLHAATQVWLLASQLPAQQSAPVVQAWPVMAQALAQVLVLASQIPVQQSEPFMHVWPDGAQDMIGPSGAPPSLPPSPPPSR